MTDDRDLRGDGSAKCDSRNSTTRDLHVAVGSGGLVTRRDVLVGTGASFVAAPLASAEAMRPYLDVTYEDQTRRGLSVAWVEKSGKDEKRHQWILRTSTFADPDLPNWLGRFVLRRTHEGWSAEIARCALTADYQFGLSISINWTPAYDPHKKLFVFQSRAGADPDTSPRPEHQSENRPTCLFPEAGRGSGRDIRISDERAGFRVRPRTVWRELRRDTGARRSTYFPPRRLLDSSRRQAAGDA